nr:unnamed protein product [Digitaria exilis]
MPSSRMPMMTPSPMLLVFHRPPRRRPPMSPSISGVCVVRRWYVCSGRARSNQSILDIFSSSSVVMRAAKPLTTLRRVMAVGSASSVSLAESHTDARSDACQLDTLW